MFTGIITDVGTVEAHEDGRFRIACAYPADDIAIGASIACDGCCLTVTEVAQRDGGAVFAVDVSAETLSRTTLGDWVPGRRVNLERSLRLSDELGGHLVTGHVDAVAEIVCATRDGESTRFEIEVPREVAPFIAPKGSVALDGTSLTVNEVSGTRFGVNLIPHSLSITTWGEKRAGDRLNLEIDLLARYVARLLEAQKQGLTGASA
ncbi:riboflavin synthase [Dichotomicrobium thermohalophilum]|uniref:Riboflavin synthase n=1 Tax=Dichotomicrobium thermohalophilum TaxID=933063 RepID=A0A397Q2W8_9HYPH|nr:riboflavin synthase [Dichotomicrobium thermohalophilum]RIA55860.1 riboflavin synthase alpha chain [Dichotomicrobium thermohalophilum]